MAPKKNECIFCKIISGEIPARIVNENKHAIAFLDVMPITNGHTLVIPKTHCTDLVTCPSEVLQDVITLVQETARQIESCKKLDPWGINYLSNQGKIAGQEVFHFHMHIIPKYDSKYGLNPSATKDNQLEDLNDVHDWLKKKKGFAKIIDKKTNKKTKV